ncbi:cytochrome P450 [Artemisia annua]|uniref:Cytochrome P450 n=1 Tax=Artemisia annua TaxID=35608 RepID=A0A2U1NJW2_ARTAN|nr:cytochrome P450 [Artemisia annua]
MNRCGSKLTKIDRILVSKHIVDLWPNSHILALPREFSDHSPLLLTNSCGDFEPIPFKFYNSWLLHNDFPSIFLSCWLNSVGQAHPHPAVNFKLKLQALKSKIKNWRSSVKLNESATTVSLRDSIDAIDTKAEISPLTTYDIENRTLLVNELTSLEHRNLKDLRQKAKNDLLNLGIDMSLIFKKKIGNGNHTRFWMDNWVGGGPLKLSFPRLYRLDTNQQCVVSDRAPTFHQHYATTSAPIATDSSQIGPSASHVGLVYNWSWLWPIRSGPDLAELEDLCSLVAHLRLSDNQDKWECIIDSSRTFTVKGMRSQITNLSTNTSLIPIRWNSIFPSKVNILTWRIANMRLPTRVNLDYRGIDLDSI